MDEILVAGTGSALADYLFTDVDFSGQAFLRYASRTPGDGGLMPGKLVLSDEIERFSGCSLQIIVDELTGERTADSVNLGGPAVVALINATQLTAGENVHISFTGAAGTDEAGRFIMSTLERTDLDIRSYKTVDGRSPVTYVFSDPHAGNGEGERTFINSIGAAAHLGPEDLPKEFSQADIVLFGATALVPRLHDSLTELLSSAKQRGAITVVSTVYDFPNERLAPQRRWPLGASDESYRMIDLLIVDREEALRLSGTAELEAAADFFRRLGVGAFVITNGAQPIGVYSSGSLFRACRERMDVSAQVVSLLTSSSEKRDTTGCGDNFAGGVIASLALQLRRYERGALDLISASALGIASGGFACFYLGGTYHEKRRGEKLARIAHFYRLYREQTADRFEILPLEQISASVE